jgi:hypothetical protein
MEMARYEIREDSGASEIIEAENMAEALETAREWASGGDYTDRCMVRVYVDELDEDGNETGESESAEVMAGPEPKPEPTDCGDEDEDHDWQSPHELLGGCRENPGVWSLTGTAMSFDYVCGRCGIYKSVRTAGFQRNPGELAEKIEYREADGRSKEWLAERCA